MLVFASLGHGLFHVIVALFLTLVLVLQPAWNIPYNDLIALWTVGALLLGLGAPIAGWLSDWVGETRLMVLFFVGTGVSCIACGLAEGPSSLWPALAAMGLFASIYHPVGTSWVVRNAQRRGREIAIVGMAGSLGVAFSSVIAGVLADLWSWRMAFFVPGAISVLTGLALLAARMTGAIRDRTTDAVKQAEASRADIWRAFVVLVVAMALSMLAYHAFTTMLPKWIGQEVSHDLGAGLSQLGAVVTMIYLVGALAQFVGGHLSDRGLTKEVYIASFALKLAALTGAMAVGSWFAVAAAVVVIFAFDVAAPAENVLIARYVPGRRRGLAYGFRHGIAILTAPLGVQIVAVFYSEATGFQAILAGLSAVIAVVLAVVLFLPADKPTGEAVPTTGGS